MNTVSSYVIKRWSVNSMPSPKDPYVDIQGRAGGFISLLMNLLGISPTVRFAVTAERIYFEKGSLEGTVHSVIPLENTCTMFYAYKRPLKEAIALGFLIGIPTFFFFGVPGILAALLYYLLNKTLTIGFTDMGGRVHEVPFKRSVIEGQEIDEAAAKHVCQIIQHLVETRQERALVSSV